MTRLWTLDVTILGRVRRIEEFGDTIDEARENTAARYGVPIAKVASVLGPDGQYASRDEERAS